VVEMTQAYIDTAPLRAEPDRDHQDPKENRINTSSLPTTNLDGIGTASLDRNTASLPATQLDNIDTASLPSVPDHVQRDLKVTKSDNAEVPAYLWDTYIEDGPGEFLCYRNVKAKVIAYTLLRSVMLKWWTRQVTRSLLNWLYQRYPEIP
jgi:hypothetical protein